MFLSTLLALVLDHEKLIDLVSGVEGVDEDNAAFIHPTDPQGNITCLTDGHELEQETETDTDTDRTDKMATSEDQNTGRG